MAVLNIAQKNKIPINIVELLRRRIADEQNGEVTV